MGYLLGRLTRECIDLTVIIAKTVWKALVLVDHIASTVVGVPLLIMANVIVEVCNQEGSFVHRVVEGLKCRKSLSVFLHKVWDKPKR